MKDPIDERLLERIAEAGERLRELDEELADPKVSQNPDRLRELGRERSDLVTRDETRHVQSMNAAVGKLA